MHRRLRVSVVASVAFAVLTATLASAQEKSDKGAPPPGMSDADMKAMMEAATPGPKHAYLAEGTGVWAGKATSWMGPGAEPVKSECKSTVTSMMDGRFTRAEIAGDMPGMGPFRGFGIYGFDNVSQTFQCTWIDNFGTGMAIGTGELSPDGKTMTWKFTYNCPLTKKPTVMREIEKRTGKDTATLEVFVIDPTSGKEFKSMEIALTRTGATSPEKAVGSR